MFVHKTLTFLQLLPAVQPEDGIVASVGLKILGQGLMVKGSFKVFSLLSGDWIHPECRARIPSRQSGHLSNKNRWLAQSTRKNGLMWFDRTWVA